MKLLLHKHENEAETDIIDLVKKNNNLKEELQRMIEMVAEANFKID